MDSFFLQMFKRGRYVSRRPSDADETKEEQKDAERERKECERFAVAAVAFCIKHDEAFKRYFLDVVAKLPPEKISEVTPEPKLHTDLVLEGDGHILVLEFKIDARLEEHQNPEEPAFWKEKGYGTKIRETFRQQASGGKELRYIVIGRDFDTSRCESLQPRKGERLHCSWVSWRKLLIKGRIENKLEEDLYDCLGHLGARVFLHRHIKTKPKYTNEAKQGMDFYVFLDWVIADADLAPGVPYWNEKAIGLNIKKSRAGTLHRKLMEAVQPKGQTLAWIGYSAWGTEVFRPAVTFYCSEKDAQEKVMKRLGENLGKPEKEDPWSVNINQAGEGHTDDAEWFKKVLNAAAGS